MSVDGLMIARKKEVEVAHAFIQPIKSSFI